MGLAEMFALSFTIGLSGAMSPGPLTVLTVAETARRGMIAPFLIVAGHAGMELLATTALSLGLLAAANSPRFIGTISLVGGTAMFALALVMFHEAVARPFSVDSPGTGTAGGNFRLLGTGAMTSISNPYFAVWWITVASGILVTAAKSGVAMVGAFYTGHILADLSYYLAIGLAVTAGRRFIGGKGYRRLMAVLALSLAGFGILFAFNGWTTLTAP